MVKCIEMNAAAFRIPLSVYKSHRLKRIRTLSNLALVRASGALVLFTFLALSHLKPQSPGTNPSFDGTDALAQTRRAVAFGERPSGSQQNLQLRNWIISQLRPLGGELSLDSFVGQTPAGPVSMANIILKLPGIGARAIAVTGHYDTKKIPMIRFVGANDGGSSTGFLIEFARVCAKTKHRADLYIVFFDGEEAVGNWTETDSLYGSRHLAAKWAADGTLSKLIALINLDMIGDKSLDILNDAGSSQSLRAEVEQIAAKLGDSQYFLKEGSSIDDDHRPFADSGVSVIDLIDFDYGPQNAYWHSAQDTLDKLSAHSFQVIGDVVLELVKRLDAQI